MYVYCLKLAFHQHIVPNAKQNMVLYEAAGDCSQFSAEEKKKYLWDLARQKRNTMVSRCSSSKMRFGDHVDLSLDISYNTDIATTPLQGSKIYSMRDYSTGRGEIICNSCGELQPVLQFSKPNSCPRKHHWTRAWGTGYMVVAVLWDPRHDR